MKFSITFKDPDGVSNCMDEAVANMLSTPDTPTDEREREAVRELRREKLGDFIEKWIDYDEYVTIEFDTDAGTAIVKEST